jgi:hypoxanthine phosphoribosyltransferase
MEKKLFNTFQIESRLIDLSDTLNNSYPSNTEAQSAPVLSPILQGGVTFFSDLSRFLLFDAYVDYIGVSSYNGKSQGSFDLYKTWNVSIQDRDVWLIDDIADSGNTLAYLEKLAYSKGANHVYKAVLLRRKTCMLDLDFSGFDLDDEWVFGYGMDHPNGLGRLSDCIYQV